MFKLASGLCVTTSCSPGQLQAKKKSGSKKKGPGSLMDPPKPAHPYLETDVIMQNLLMVESYKRKVGRCAYLKFADLLRMSAKLMLHMLAAICGQHALDSCG